MKNRGMILDGFLMNEIAYLLDNNEDDLLPIMKINRLVDWNPIKKRTKKYLWS